MAALTDIKKLDAHMADNSYVEGYSATQKDVSVFQAISKPADSFPNALRWYEHIASFSAMKLAALPGTPEKLAAAASSSSSAPAPAAEKKEKAPKEKKEPQPKKEKAPAEKKEEPKKDDAAEAEKKAAKDREKFLAKIVKEGGKKGVEIEGASDMGGLDFFCTTMELPEGDTDLLLMSMDAMNAVRAPSASSPPPSPPPPPPPHPQLHHLLHHHLHHRLPTRPHLQDPDPEAEDRKGCSGHVGKMIYSAGVSQLAIVAYVPDPAHNKSASKVDVTVWMDHVRAPPPSRTAPPGLPVPRPPQQDAPGLCCLRPHARTPGGTPALVRARPRARARARTYAWRVSSHVLAPAAADDEDQCPSTDLRLKPIN